MNARDAGALPDEHHMTAVGCPHGRGRMADVDQLIDRQAAGGVHDQRGGGGRGECDSKKGLHRDAVYRDGVSHGVPSTGQLLSNFSNKRSNRRETTKMPVAGGHTVW